MVFFELIRSFGLSVLVFIFCCFGHMLPSASDRWSGIVDQGKNFATGFGYVAPSWRFSFKVWNDAAIPIYVIRIGQRTVMGCHFPEDVIRDGPSSESPGVFLMPGTNSQNLFFDTHLEYSIFIINPNGQMPTEFYTGQTLEYFKKGVAIGTVGELVLPGISNLLGGIIGALSSFIKNQANLHKNAIFERAVTVDAAGIAQLDANVYNFRAYTTAQGETKVEHISYVDTTTQFNGMFHNKLEEKDAEKIVLTFMYKQQNFNVLLEPSSYNFLVSSGPEQPKLPEQSKNSPQADSIPLVYVKKTTDEIRPSADQAVSYFTLKNNDAVVGQIPISPFGLLPLHLTQDQQDTYIKQRKSGISGPYPIASQQGSPFCYRYEIAKNDGRIVTGAQPFIASSGQSAPTTLRQRNITPLTCLIFVDSEESAKKNAAAKSAESFDSIYFLVPGETYWCAYRTADCSFTKKLEVGKVTEVLLVRPRISEKKARLCIAAVSSDDEARVTKFFDRLFSGAFDDSLKLPQASSVVDDGMVQLSELPDAFCTIDDSRPDGSGLKATVIGYDVFGPCGQAFLKGNPSTMPHTFYYQVTAPSLSIADLAASLSQFFDPKKIDGYDLIPVENRVAAYFAKQIPQWISDLPKKTVAGIQAEVVAALKKYGIATGPGAPFEGSSGTLSEVARGAVETFLTGKVSIQNPSFFRFKLAYQSDRSIPPEGWPKAEAASLLTLKSAVQK